MAQAAAPASEAEALVSISCLDFLLIELVPMAERMARSYEASLDRPSLTNKPMPLQTHTHTTSTTSTSISAGTTTATTTKPTTSGSQAGAGAGAGTSGPPSAGPTTGTATIALTYDGLPETEVFKDSVYFRLETLGYRVGQGLSERFSRDRPRFSDHLDVIKFLCKDLWGVVFKKQIDNLKTNHRGVFVLTDSKFRPFTRMSMTNNTEAVMRAQPHLYFPCGIIRGVLSSLGIKSTVQAETSELPIAVFQIKTVSAKS